MVFKNRKEAGEKLAPLLNNYKNSNALVLGIPKGGVEIAYYLSAHLQAELSVLISKKLSYPGHEEYGFGAICEHDIIYLDSERHLLTDDIIQKIIDKGKKEIQHKVTLYRGGLPLPEIQNRVVILADDGISSGITLLPAIRLCRKLNAARVIVAVPVAGKIFDPHLKAEADEIKIVHQPEMFCNINQAYKSFQTLTEAETIAFLKHQPVFLS
jgi:putative phosphoribosyl transferase